MQFKITHFYIFAILELLSMVFLTPVIAAGKNQFLTDETVKQIDNSKQLETAKQAIDNDEAGLEATIQHNFSPEDRARLRKALADYAKSTDPEHEQIEAKRKAMKDSVEARFNECNKDNDDSIDHAEATQCLPQVARHFNFVDIDEDDVITLEELQLAQAKKIERQKAEEAKMEAKHVQEIEADIKSKNKNKLNKQAINTRKRPG